jgi:hypothetical protein
MILPRPGKRYDPTEEARRNLELEQADRQNWKLTGDVDHPHSLNVQGDLTIDDLPITAGTYTPTLTNVANLDGSTAYECQYLRVGSVVTVSGKVDVNPTAGAVQTRLGISLPVASDFGAEEDCGGAAFAHVIAGQGAAIRADSTNNRADMTWLSGDTTSQPMSFTFTYAVI